jgi:hypothetical protein
MIQTDLLFSLLIGLSMALAGLHTPAHAQALGVKPTSDETNSRSGGKDLYEPVPATYEEQLRDRRTLRRTTGDFDPVMLTGIVLDETLTQDGRAFYTAFQQIWQAPANGGYYSIQIRESPVPGRGTQVQVYVNDTIIYRARLVPGPNAVGEHPQRAARRTYRYVESGRANWLIY